MLRRMLKSKIHRATVTEANVEYEGSISIDTDLLEAANILPYEAVDVWDCTNGARLSTYAIPGERGSGEICINGAAAHLVKPHDLVIIASWVQVAEEEVAGFEATRVFVDESNAIRD
ncbi:MAG: aspartate 1-decarboxylase [Myxococcales bacterium]|nr:aspartate 1-decarboxylase [Myxococcales bacterium]